MAIFHGTKHDDDLNGTSGDDTFDLYKGGEDTAHGGAGDDVFNMGASLDAGDRLDGGSGRDAVTIRGDYSAGLVFQDQTIQNIEAMRLGSGFDYKLTMADGNVAAGAFLSVYANALGAAHSLTFDGSAETDGHYLVTGGAGNDAITGGAQADKFHLEDGGNDIVHGGGGDDVFAIGGALTAADTIDGGAGNDTLVLNGTYFGGTALTLGAATITGIETIAFDGSHSYSITANDGNVGSGDTLTVDASANGSGLVIFNGAAELDGSFHFMAGAGTNEFTGGAGNDVFDLAQGTSSGHQTEGNGGNDVFNVGADLGAYIAGGTSAGIDGGAGSDTLDIDGVYAGTIVLAVAGSPIRSVETVTFGGGDSYTVQVANDIAGGATLTIDASAASNISIDLTAATSAAYVITGSAGDDTIKGANAATAFHLEAGGNDTVTGGSANDVFYLGGALAAADAINGGGGSNTLVLDGDYSAGLTFGATTVTNVQTIDLTAGHDYNITLNAATVSLFNLTVDGSNLGAGDSLTFDASAAGRPVTLIGGAGDDVLTGGPIHNAFDISHGGDDIVHASGLASVRAGAAFTAADTIFGSGSTSLELHGDYSAGVTTTHVTGVSEIVADQGHSYDIILAAATVTAGNQLHVTSNSGSFDGSDSLTVDASQIGGSVRFESQFASSDFTGGSGDDTIIMDYVGASANTLHGGGGDDIFNLFGAFGTDDFVDGGTGNDTLELSPFGVLSTSNVTGIDSVVVKGSGGMAGAITGDITGGKGVLTIEVDNLSSVHLDLSAATSAGYSISMPGTGPGTFVFAGNFSASDVVDGGGSDDTLELSGDYSAGLTFGATTIAAIDTIKVDDGFSYKLTMNANDTAGNTQTIDASALGATHTLTFDGSAEANSILVEFGAGFTAADSVIGGSGSDTLQFNGDYASLALSTAQAGSIETLKFLGNHSYTGVTVTGDIAGGSTLTIDAGAASNLSIDLGAATSAAYAITGSGGNDTIKFAGNFSASDSVNGGAGNDTLELNGDYSAGLTLGATTVTNIETIKVDDGHSYDFVSNDATVASGATLTVDASALTGSNQLFFNGSAETDGHFAFIGGAGDDDLQGGSQSDTFDLSRSDGAFVFGNGGSDTFTITSAAKLLDDSIDGGAGSDTLILNGDFSTQTALTNGNLTSIEALQLLGAANGYNLTVSDGIATAMTVDASAVSSLTFSGAGDTTTAFTVTGSAGNDTIAGGNKADTIAGGAGADTLTGGGGADIFSYTSVSQSNTVNGYDTITDLASADSIHIAVGVPTFFAGETVSAYQGSLDADLASALSGMGAGKYAVVTLTGGADPLDGHTFLVVDGNGTAGYTAGADYVIDITNFTGDPSLIHFI
jgi:Ca2+-binding RTX toxin-like protein